MRGQHHDLTLSPTEVDRFVRASPPVDGPAPPPPSGLLQDHGGGTAIINDAVTTVAVSPDGAAHFTDKRNVQVHLPISLHPVADLGDMLEQWQRDPNGLAEHAGRVQDLPRHMTAVPGAGDRYGDGADLPGGASDSATRSGGGVPILSGTFDLTDAAMRWAHVGDPYAARKLALLDRTRDERVARGTQFRREQLAHSNELMRANLAAMATAPGDGAAHRTMLFELWDECGEGDDSAGQAGERARALVIGWIRAHIPPGSPDAFTAAEIAAFDARRSSHAHFAPYE